MGMSARKFDVHINGLEIPTQNHKNTLRKEYLFTDSSTGSSTAWIEPTFTLHYESKRATLLQHIITQFLFAGFAKRSLTYH